MWCNEDSKLYKVNNFPNSEGEPFGLTIKGRGKHIEAHNKVMDTLNRLQKNKATVFGDVELTVTDKVKTNTILNAKVTITTKDDYEGQAEIKIHEPSDKRRQATIEIRKLTGYEYDSVEKVKELLTNMLDNFTLGQTVSKVMVQSKIKAKPYTPIVRQPSLSTKFLSCTECEFKIKTMVALKNHIDRTHKNKKVKCEACGFESNEIELKDHIQKYHLAHEKQSKRKKVVFGCDECGVTVDAQNKLTSHKESQHPKVSSSPEPSPPRKKLVKKVEVKTGDDPEVEMVDLQSKNDLERKEDSIEMSQEYVNKEISKKDEIIEAQGRKIAEQEKEIQDIKAGFEAMRSITKPKAPEIISKKTSPIPEHLSPVQDKHLKDLGGIRMKCNGNPGGDCLSSCTTIHLSNTRNSSERRRVNKRINNHIADHFDKFYVNKIALPYIETVGVGSMARQVTCNTREELLDFLRSEDSLCAYSNFQELLAICNLLNINIHVFTYGIGGDESSWSWKTIQPDPEMKKYCEFSPGTVPDMYLYNSDNCHFDLLVEESSRLAVFGLISIVENEVIEKFQKKDVIDKHIDEGQQNSEDQNVWETVNRSKNVKDNKVLLSTENQTTDSEEMVLAKQKLNGHKRANPQSAPIINREQNVIVKQSFVCEKCSNIYANSDQLEDHKKKHENESTNDNYCDICQEDLPTKLDFIKHNKNEHSEQWNCDVCDFQGSTRQILLKHCKVAPGHQPSQTKKQRLGGTGVSECYTCKQEFRSYHALMNHRKEEHPSKKKCRYFAKGECNFSAD